MTSGYMEIIPIDGPAGAEVLGIDLTEALDDSSFAKIEAAFDTYGVLVVRNQNLRPSEQLTFAMRFGEIEVNYNSESYGLPDHPEIYLISNITQDGKPIGSRRAGENWHSDMIYSAKPPRATMLYALEVPELYGLTLGDTAFANAAAAWNELPESTKQELRGLRGVFDFRGRKRSEAPDKATIARYPPVRHPLARTHSRTGQTSLYVNRDDCTGIDGWPTQKAEAFIAALADHVVRPEFVYRHRWRAGDLVMWDNSTMQHKAILDYDLPQRRLMHRLTIAGSVPI